MPETKQFMDINAPIADVWTRISDFHDLSYASNVISSVDKIGGFGAREVGAKRVLNNAFHETLVEIDDDAHYLKYSIDDGPSPVSKDEVSNYFGFIQLTGNDDHTQTHVSWRSNWDSNTDDAVEFCHGIYVALLGELAASFS